MKMPAEFQSLMDWLIGGVRSETEPTAVMEECCERLVAAGVPLWRVGVFIRTLHPEIFGMNFVWKPGAKVEVGTADFTIVDSDVFNHSPLKIVLTQGIGVGRRAADRRGSQFPTIGDLAPEGVTDYIALPLLFMDGSV